MMDFGELAVTTIKLLEKRIEMQEVEIRTLINTIKLMTEGATEEK